IVRDVVAKHKRFEHEPVRKLVARHATVDLRVAEPPARSLVKRILLWHPLATLISLSGLEKRLGSQEQGLLTDEGVSRERVPLQREGAVGDRVSRPRVDQVEVVAFRRDATAHKIAEVPDMLDDEPMVIARLKGHLRSVLVR